MSQDKSDESNQKSDDSDKESDEEDDASGEDVSDVEMKESQKFEVVKMPQVSSDSQSIAEVDQQASNP